MLKAVKELLELLDRFPFLLCKFYANITKNIQYFILCCIQFSWYFWTFWKARFSFFDVWFQSQLKKKVYVAFFKEIAYHLKYFSSFSVSWSIKIWICRIKRWSTTLHCDHTHNIINFGSSVHPGAFQQ